MVEVSVHGWAVLVSGVAAMFIGFLWYGPLFGKAWMKHIGIDPTDNERLAKMQQGAKTAYPRMFIGALLMAFVFAHVLEAFGAETIGVGLQGALWMWLGFIVPVMYGKVLWEGKSHGLFFIDAFYYLVDLGVMSIILILWK